MIWAFLKTTWRICPIKLGQKIFCITLCLGEITILNCGSERSSSLWWRNDILSRTDFSYLFLFFLLSSFFFHTDKNDYYHQQLTSSGIHMNEQEWERHIKQKKICEGCFSHVQTLTSLVRWLNKFFSFNASLVWV